MTDSLLNTNPTPNQPPDFYGHNAYLNDPVLMKITLGLGDGIRKELAQLGQWAATAETRKLARLANSNLPVLNTHDRRGNRIDQVEFHPAYHALMRKSVSLGLHASTWENIPAEKGMAHLARAARFFLVSGVETGHLCPMTMTHASVAALKATPDVAKEWLPRLCSRQYDSTMRPPVKKAGLTIGMGMTEKQGGTDVKTNTTTAVTAGDGLWKITGHKWFLSAPMCDAFLVLAQVRQGLSCFLVPRILPSGQPNGLRFQRLKNKLGNRSNASSEVEFHGALAHLIGEAGKGIATIMQMVSLTRLDCAIASASLMRISLAEAVHHARHRKVMGKLLIEHPLMIRVLADMALDVAAATALSMRLAAAMDRAASDEAEAHFVRLMTPVIKYWVCKIAPAVTLEAMECLGGNGYCEDFDLARNYREAPVNSIWEGSGNVMALDVLRVLQNSPKSLDAVLGILASEFGPEGGTTTVNVIRSATEMALRDPGSARILTEQIALTAAASELRRLGQGSVADAFVETRLGGMWRSSYGMLDNRYDGATIINHCYGSL